MLRGGALLSSVPTTANSLEEKWQEMIEQPSSLHRWLQDRGKGGMWKVVQSGGDGWKDPRRQLDRAEGDRMGWRDSRNLRTGKTSMIGRRG